MPYLHTEGPTLILSATGQSSGSTAGTTSVAGDWYRVHPGIGRLAWQVRLQTSSAGATAGTTVQIQVTHSTAIGPVATIAQTFALSATTDSVTDGGVFASSMAGAWAFVRANINSLTTSTAGSTGVGPAVNVYMNAGYVGQA